MPLYFLVHDAQRFGEVIRPALAASWRRRSFEPCCDLCATLAPQVRAFQERYYIGQDEPMLWKLNELAFDRHLWRLLVGELLLYAAVEIPEIPTAPETLTCLLARHRPLRSDLRRDQFAPIQQVHFGTHDLAFGTAIYQPERTGYNDDADVARLADYLDAIDPAPWSAAELTRLPELANDEDRAEELELAREWFPLLCGLYRRACKQNQVIVCDIL
jgi:hypothetical protein